MSPASRAYPEDPAGVSRLARGVLLLATLASVGCGGETTPAPASWSFAADPDQAVISDAGALRIAVRFSPRPPSVGAAAAQLTISDRSDPSGAGTSGLGLTVVPWMPAHGHGASVDPTVTETAPGTFVAEPLYLSMPGSWELRMTTSGSVDDTAKATFEVR